MQGHSSACAGPLSAILTNDMENISSVGRNHETEEKAGSGTITISSSTNLTGAFKTEDEDEALKSLLTRFNRERKPVGLAEELLVERLAACGLQLQQMTALKKRVLLSTSLAPGVLSRLSPKMCERIYMAGVEPFLPKERPLTKEMCDAAVLQAPSLGELVGGDEQRPCLNLSDVNLLLKFQKYEREMTAAFAGTLRELSRVQESRRLQSKRGRSVQSSSGSKLRGTPNGSTRGKPARQLSANVADPAR
jgi:hypothetical protein